MNEDLRLEAEVINRMFEQHRLYLARTQISMPVKFSDVNFARLTGVGGERTLSFRFRDARHAIFSECNFSGVDMTDAVLTGCIFNRCNMRGAIMNNAEMSRCSLDNNDFWCADFNGANLDYASFGFSNLKCARFYGASLRGAQLFQAKDVPDLLISMTSILPEGDLIGWKLLTGQRVAKLLIPASAKRSNATGRKCRCSEAQVLDITDRDGNKHFTEGFSFYKRFVYQVGETVKPTLPFDENRWEECASGIHFFITRQEALDF